MSSTPATAAQSSQPPERRAHPRRRLNELAYIGFGPDSGGVLLDLSVDGLRCQIVGAVVQGQRCHLKFALPGRHAAIETDGRVVWSNESKQGGGVRLLGLGDDIRQQLEQWIGGGVPTSAGGAPIAVSIRTETRTESIAKSGVSPGPGEAATLVPAPEAPVTVTSIPPVLAGIETQPLAEAHRLPNPIRINAEVLAPETSTAAVVRPPAPPPASPHPPAPIGAQPKLSLAMPLAGPRTWRSTRTAAVAACVVFGFAALAFAGFDLASVLDLVSGENGSGVVRPLSTAAPVPPAEAAGPRFSANLPNAITATLPASNAAGAAARAVTEPPRPAIPISNSTPPPIVRPVQRPPAAPAAIPENRQELAMASPLPRAPVPQPPVAVLPEPAPAPVASPPVALMDTQPLEARPPEVAQPVRPQPAVSYQQAELITRVEPVYSRFARDARLQGTVQISATIGPDGRPRALSRVSGNAALADMALAAVRQWVYQPAMLNGQPTESSTVINFNFQIR